MPTIGSQGRKRALLAAAVALVVLLAAYGGLFYFVSGIARDNLTNAEFERAHPWTPEAFGLAYDNHTIPSGDLRLAAWWIPPPKDADPQTARTTVIVVHGIGANMAYFVKRWVPNLHEAGYAVLAMDLRNHGASDDGLLGYVTYGAAEAADVLAAMGYVRDNSAALGVDPDRVVLYGGSMGAATVLTAASADPPGLAAVIADSPFASLSFQARIDGAADGYPRFLVDWVVSRMSALAPANPLGAAADRTVPGIDAPLLLMHCVNDARVQVASFDVLVAVAPAGTQTWRETCPTEINDDHHVEGWLLPGYNETVRGFLSTV